MDGAAASLHRGTSFQNQPCFDFDRPRYETIAWDRLAVTNFPRAANGFSYNLRFTLEMSRELDGRINDD